MAEPIVNIINPTTFLEQVILPEDRVLIQNQEVDSPFDLTKDQVELYVYDYNQNILVSDYNFLAWKSYNDPSLVATNKLEDLYIDPAIDGTIGEVTNGLVYLIYNFVSNKLNSSDNQRFYIDSISSDRTEITLKTNNLSNLELETLTSTFLTELQSTPYFQEFYLNFGDNNSIIGVNIRVNKNNPDYSLDVKLYEPLPADFGIKSTCWVQTRIADPAGYSVQYNTQIEFSDERIALKGPNYNLKINGESSVATNFENLTTLKQTDLSGSKSQIDYILKQKGVTLNIDYSDFNNFVHFSSAETRLENFYYKASLIEGYQNSINAITASNTVGTRSTSISILQGSIDSLIENFDDYEYYLYFNSGSKAWPKTTTVAPFTLASTGSTEVLNWYGNSVEGAPYYGGQRYSASVYDNSNQDNLIYTIPQYIVNDSVNQPYITFIEMTGQHFDTLYTYTNAINQKYNADNRLNYGISKDLIADTLKSFGIKIYENNFTTADLYSAFTGLTPSGSTLLLPNITTTYPVTSSGVEFIQTIITGSNESIPLDDLNKSIYKRLYHNLPLLVKKKGSLEGLRLLINSYGTPETILRINEFGGKDRNISTYDNWQQDYNYKYNTQGVSFVTSSFTLNSSWNASSDKPQAVEFRFQTFGLPSSSYSTQSLWSTDTGAALILKYTGSGYTSGSYSGSSVDPYYQYGVLEFYPSSSNVTTTASIYLPFFDRGWWSVLINRNSSTGFTVYAKNKIYNGDSGNILGYQASSSVSLANPWTSATKSYFATSSLNSKVFSGSLQEFRYYTQPISESSFDAYVMNPYSIEQSELLAFRGTLGGELYTSSISIHPKVSGTQTTTSSFASTSTFYITGSGQFQSNVETFFFDQVAAGIKNAVSNKIKVGAETNYGTTLSKYISIEQATSGSYNVTPGVNYLEVGFSPQNEINEDINSQFGYFNIGEYIGDPRDISNDNFKYPALDQLSLDYFKKYTASYNYTDYLRLIKFFDNSLFKLIKDFIPARTSAATGAIVKQHLLERNRQRPAQLDYTQPEYTGSVTSLARDYQTGSIEVFTGGAGGSVNVLTNVTQSWTSSILTKAGLVTEIESSQYEFFNGEYSGSVIDVVENKLQDNPLLGADFRVAIPDLQNLDVELSSNFNTGAINNGPYTFPFGTFYSTNGGNFAGFPLNEVNKAPTYYNTGTYTYTPGYDIQADLVFNFSGSVTNSIGTYFFIEFLITENGNTIGSYLNGPNYQDTGTEAFQGVLTVPNCSLVAGREYMVKYRFGSSIGGATVGIVDSDYTSWTVSVDNLAAQSTYYLDPTVYTQQNFPGNINNYSDYNSLLNNVYSNRVSNKYFDVDYSQDALSPINFETIVSQSAIYAQVQDSNYITGSAWSKARYEGTKLKSATYNTYTAGDTSYGQTAVIDQYTDYFLYYSNIVQQVPDLSLIPYGGNVRGVALISINGDVISLTPDNQNIGLVQQIFGVFDTVKLVTPSQYLGTDTSTLTLTTIIAGGVQNYLETFNILTSTPDETNVFIGVVDSYPASVSTLNTLIFSDSPGYLIPANFNKDYLSKVTQIAEAAGFPIN